VPKCRYDRTSQNCGSISGNGDGSVRRGLILSAEVDKKRKGA